MDELNDLLRSMTAGMNGGKAPRRDRPAPPGLPSRSQRLGRTEPALCERCGGAGFLIDDLPVGHPDYGRPVPCRCKLEERRSQRRSRFKDVHRLEALARFTFEAFETNISWLPPHKRDSLARAYDTAQKFAMNPDGWLLFTGTYGCGKTHLAAAIANHRIENDQSAIFVVVPDLLDHLRSAFGPSSEASYDDLFDEVRSTAVLILDDLGVQSITPWAQEKLYQILNHRYNSRLPTVLTTNQRLEDLDQRLRSRLQEELLVEKVSILAPDYRAGTPSMPSPRHAAQVFETFQVQRRNSSALVHTNLREVKMAAEAFADSPEGWLVLLGASGAGKTHLAAAISNAQGAAAQVDIMFVVVPDLLDYLRAAFNPQSPIPYDRRFDELKRTPMLVLDDLGTESATAWAKEKLFQLLDFRYKELLPTVITSRIAEDKLEPWLRTRINDAIHCQVLTIETTGYRGSADQMEARQLKRPQKPSSGEIPY